MSGRQPALAGMDSCAWGRQGSPSKRASLFLRPPSLPRPAPSLLQGPVVIAVNVNYSQNE